MLEEGEALQERLRDLLEMEEGKEGESNAKSIAARMWPLVGRYNYMNRKGQATDVMYILDEVGLRFRDVFPRRYLGLEKKKGTQSGDDEEELINARTGAGFRCALVFHPLTNEAFTAFWPRRAVAEGEIATCDNLPHGQAARLARLQVLMKLDAAASSTMQEDKEGEKEGMVETAHRLRLILEGEGYCDVGQINALLGLESTYGKLLPVWDISEPRLRAEFLKHLDAALKMRTTSMTTEENNTISSSSLTSTAPASAAAAAAADSSPSSLVFLIKFFLMGMAVPCSDLLTFVQDHGLLKRLEDLGLLFVEGHDNNSNDDTTNGSNDVSVKSLVQITPVPFRSGNGGTQGYGCGLFLTDFSQVGSGVVGFDPVMYVGPDSLGLVGAMPSYTATAGVKEEEGGGGSDLSASSFLSVPRRILDLCAGCGVQGIVAALRAQQQEQQSQKEQQQQPQKVSIFEQLVLLELNPRAVRFATFNAALNHLQEQTTVLQHDARTVTPADLPLPAYDIVLSNPPYIPNPERSARHLHQYGDGGKTGEEITQAVVALAAQVLSQKNSKGEEEGWLYLVGNLVNVDTLPERVERWWNDGLSLNGGKQQQQQQQQQQEQQQQQQKQQRLYIKAFHGLKWSLAEYSALIHNYRLEDTATALAQDAAVHRYKEALKTAHVRDVTNGLVFVQWKSEPEKEEAFMSKRCSSSSSSSNDNNNNNDKNDAWSSCKRTAVALHAQLWQVLAMYYDPEASDTRRKLAEGWM
ncbi:carbamoyltransferase [Nannochloropsis oceanica]